MTQTAHYPTAQANPDFPAIERDVQAYWQRDNVFKASVSARAASASDGSNNEYVFYDGPPFANGLPHYGHLLTGYVKDVFARYHTMKGKRVERRFGWDCHGLPAEMAAEKALQLSGRQQIQEYGIDKFNDWCRELVTGLAGPHGQWKDYVDAQGRWVDMEDDYKTMDTNFMESVLWAFKELYKKGLIYEAYRVMPYSWAAETPVSNFETKLDNAYREKIDKAITVAFSLQQRPQIDRMRLPENADDYQLLAWTTTPWTLPSNLALAAGAEMDYLPIVKDNICHIVSAGAVKSYQKQLFNDGQFETARCILRPFTEADEQLIIDLHTHAQVMESVNDGVQTPEEARENLAEFIKCHKADGYSQWAVFHKETGAFMGRAGLQKYVQRQDGKGEAKPVLRAALMPDFWHGGYGTELCQYVTMLGFTLFGLEEAVAGAHGDNKRSHEMIERIGYIFQETVMFKRVEGPYYTIPASNS